MRIFFGHEPADAEGNRFVALQRAAATAGLAYLDTTSHLCLHPKFGAWFALRAVLIFDAVKFTGEPKRLHETWLLCSADRLVEEASCNCCRGDLRFISLVLVRRT